jgi:release factor glutamine methyltransferase
VTLAAALAAAAAALAANGCDEPRRRARRVVAAARGLSPAEMIGHPERCLSPAELGRVDAVLARVLAREPLSRILAHREFWGLDLALSADTLDPRPETETIVEAVLERLPDRTAPLRFLDLGTGSGAILLALLSECLAARGLGVDIAIGAVAAARRNAAALGLGARSHFLCGDWAAAVAHRFDAVVANPPYIATADLARLPPEVRCWDPRQALDGGHDGLAAYRRIAADLPRLLTPTGFFACEIGRGLEAAVAQILGYAGLGVEAAVPDLAGIPRVLVARPLPKIIVGI